MAAFVYNSSLAVSERNSMAIMLNIHTKSHTVHGGPTVKLVEHFWNGLKDQFARLTMNFTTVKVTLPETKINTSRIIHDLCDNSFNPSRGWVFCPFVTLPVSVILFTCTQTTTLYH